MIPVIFLMGSTCSGKGTFCEFAKKTLGRDVATIGIGAEMRKRFPPEHFKGLAAMPETESVVWEIFDAQWAEALKSGAKMIIVDGQPRLPSQVEKCLTYQQPYMAFRFVLLHASMEARRRRIEARFPIPVYDIAKANEFEELRKKAVESRKLAEARITNDNIQLFDVWAKISLCGHQMTVVNTNETADTYQRHLLQMLCEGL